MSEELRALHSRLAALEGRLHPRGSSPCGAAQGYEDDTPEIDPRNADPMATFRPGHLQALITRRQSLGALANGSELSGHILYLHVPANKRLFFTVDHSAAYEVGVKISANDTSLFWRRNSYEPNHPVTELPAVNFERYFQFEGLFKRCWVGNRNCASRSWNPCPSVAIIRESGAVTGSYVIELMWDDSRVPAQARNIGCLIEVRS
jgi:hypothetical protein